MDRGKVKYSMQDLYSLAWVFCLAFGTAVEIPSSPPLYAIGLLTDVVRASSRWQTQSPHSPMLRPTRERTLYVLVSLKRKKKKRGGGGELLIPHHRFLNQLPRGRTFQRRRRRHRHNGPRETSTSSSGLTKKEQNKRAELSWVRWRLDRWSTCRVQPDVFSLTPALVPHVKQCKWPFSFSFFLLFIYFYFFSPSSSRVGYSEVISQGKMLVISIF